MGIGKNICHQLKNVRRSIAEENGIPVFEDPPLARSMFAQVSVDSVIPPVFYKAVAELIHRVYAASPQTRRVN